jgi:hypothetical protein
MPYARKLGWNDLDPHYGYFPGDIICINGYPSMGKTVLAQNLMAADTKKYNTRHLIYSPENLPASSFYEPIMEIYAGKSLDKRSKRSFVDQGGISFKEAKEWAFEYFRVYELKKPATLAELRNLAIEENCQHIFADPWNRLIREAKYRSMNIDQYIQEELTEEIFFGLGTGITSTITVHPPTQQGNDRKYDKDGGFDHPSAFQAEGGKVWFSSVHVFATVHRPPYSEATAKQTLLYVQKLKRHKYYGIPTYDKDPLIFEMRPYCNRLYLNEQSPLDTESPTQLKLYENREHFASNDRSDDLPF